MFLTAGSSSAGNAVSTGKARVRFGELQAISCQALFDNTIYERGIAMKTMHRVTVGAVSAALLFGLMGCSGMSTQDRDTAIGVGVGAVGGAALTGGSAAGAIGGAAVGGVVGHEIGKDKR